MKIGLIIYGRLQTLSGGYLYDRKLVEHLEAAGDQLQIYETYPQKTLKGIFSRLSKTLAIDLESRFGIFDGTCTAAN